MNIKLIVIGETNSKDLKQLIDLYTAKLKFYVNFELIILKDQKSKLQKNIQIKKEGEKIISVLKKNDFIVILDETGQHKSSLEFSEFIQKKSEKKFYSDEVCKHGYCRGSEPYAYVQEVMERYTHYVNLIRRVRQ